jgi:hypothetical protein
MGTRKGRKTRPTKPGDLLLPTRVPEWSDVRGVCNLSPLVDYSLPCTAAAFAQQSIKKIFKKSSIGIRSEGLVMGRTLDYSLERLRPTE